MKRKSLASCRGGDRRRRNGTLRGEDLTTGRLLKLNQLTIWTQLDWTGALQGCTLEESSLGMEMSLCSQNSSYLALHQCLPQGHCYEFWSRGCVDLLHRHLSLRRHLCKGRLKIKRLSPVG